MIKTDEPVYTKVGRRYKEIGRFIELDLYRYNKDNPELPSAALLVFQKNSTSYLRNIDIDSAGAIAAIRLAQNAMVEAMVKESKLKPSSPPEKITPEQRELLDKLELTGFNSGNWYRESMVDIVDAGIKALENVMENSGYES